MKILPLLPFLFSAGLALAAEPDPRLAGLEAAFNRVHQEQQSLYQQFQMTQELRRMALQEAPGFVQGSYGMGVDVTTTRGLDYDDNVRRQREREERLQRYERDISQAYARYLELGEQKRTLLEQIVSVAQSLPAGR